MQGKIIKGIAGFYYVYVAESGLYECKARGLFRKEGVKPLVGDDVELEALGTCSDTGYPEGTIREILPRRNSLIRPAVANVDGALLVMAYTSPEPNPGLLDRFLIMMAQQEVPCAILFNKEDLSDGTSSLPDTYAAYPVFSVSVKEETGLEKLRAYLSGRTTAIAGPSGVGKSSLINALTGGQIMETGRVSEKIERGRHTTRHSELIPLGGDTYLCDTPGFTSLYITGLEARDLQLYYPEFEPYLGQCYYEDCAHVKEPDCVIRKAVDEGHIPVGRYESYVNLYTELKSQKKYK